MVDNGIISEELIPPGPARQSVNQKGPPKVTRRSKRLKKMSKGAGFFAVCRWLVFVSG